MRRVVLGIGMGLWASLIAWSCGPALAGAGSAGASSQVISLDGDQWLLAPDPKNVGRQEQWWKRAPPGAKRTKVPWIIQDAFPGYHGVAWYWRDFDAQLKTMGY